MRIAGWHVDGFGHLCDLEAHDLPDGLVVLHGANEAGKSTLVDFLTGMLFGFPKGATRLTKRPPSRGGDHGGRLWLADGTDALLLARTPKRLVVRRAAGDEVVSDAEFDHLLGGATRRLFEAVFAVDLDDLHSLDALDDDQLNDLVFSAGVVGAGRSATAAIDLAEARRAALYRPRGRIENYALLRLKGELREAEQQLASAQRAASSVPALRRSLEAAEADAVRLRDEISAIDRRQRDLATLLDLWPTAVDAAAATRQLREQPEEVAVGVDVVTRVEGLLQAVAESRADVEQQAAVLAAAEGAAVAIRPDQPALAVAEAVDDLRQRAALAGRDRSEVLALRHRAEAATAAVEEALVELGGHVDRAHLRTPPDDVLTSDALATQGTIVQQARDAERAAADLVERIEHEQVERSARLRSRRSTLVAEGSADVRSADDRVARLQRLARLVEPPAGAPDRPVAVGPRASWLALTVAAAAVVFLLAGLVAGSGGAGPVLLAGAALLGGVAVLVARMASAAGPAPPMAPDLAAERDALARAVGIERTDPATVAAAHDEARAARDEVAARAAALAALDRDEIELTAADGARLADAEERHRRASVAAAAARATWQSWLADHGIPADLSPAGAVRFTELVSQARVRFEEARRATARADDLARGVAAFDVEIVAVADQLGVPAVDPIATLEVLAARVGDGRAAAEARREVDHLVAARAEAHRVAADRLATAEAAVAAQLAAVGVASIDALGAAAARTTERQALTARITAFERAVEVAGGAVGAPSVRAALATGDPAGWAAEGREVAGRRAGAEEARDVVVAEASDLRSRLGALERSADVATAVLVVAGLRGELRSALREWMVLGLAKGLMSETLARYQRERQPRVLARAQELFDLVTGGRYPVLRTEGRAVIAVDHAGRDVAASALSRGTREQLYLCLRFALADSFAERASLPILLDDVLVNFDPGRAAAVAAVVAAVAQRHQVLAFTCHPWVRDLLVAAAPTATEISLEVTTGALVPVRHGQPPAAATRLIRSDHRATPRR